ncbi:MAG: DNA adenine methylase [Defluviitaleaceae bacterium]|nr:DNA adenine methylase [Defluviitaleaceae bacterium]
MLKPILKYPGGKARELKHILPIIPRTVNRFFEPFVGGGAAYFSFDNAKQYFINDASKELISAYRAVKTQDIDFFDTLTALNEDWKLLATLEHSSVGFAVASLSIVKKYGLEAFFIDYLLKMYKQKRAYIQKQESLGNVITAENELSIFETAVKSSYYAAVRKIYNQNRKLGDLQANAAFYFFVRELCYSSMFRFSANGDFNVPYGGMSYNSKSFDEKLKYLRCAPLLSRLENTDIYDTDFQEFVEMFRLRKDDFLFLDPPYDTEFSTYDENEFGKKDQARLADCLRSLQAKWLLVIKDTDFIRGLYPQGDSGIFYQEFDKSYSVSFMNRNAKNAKHLIITNYEVV